MLLPLTPLYRLAVAFRDLRLRSGREPVRRLQFPVISIGNLSTGGAGKTPFAITLARALTGAGFSVDVLSRGFGRRTGAPARVRAVGSVEEFGDEPLLIAREGGVPVYVASQRYEAGRLAEADASPEFGPHKNEAVILSGENKPVILSGVDRVPGSPATGLRRWGGEAINAVEGSAFQNAAAHPIHILDDAFQHRQLHRDIDILLLNRDDWHGRLLPAGNLREPREAARRATIIAIPASDLELEATLRNWGWQGPVWRLHRHMEIPPVSGPVLAFCGIARPGQFFAGLEASGLHLAGQVAFRDHHNYATRDLHRLHQAAHAAGAAALITTAKDQVRLTPLLAALPPDRPLLTAGLRIEIEDESAALDWLVARLKTIPPRPPL